MFLRFQGHRMDFRDTRSTSWLRNGPRVGAWNNSPNENSVETCPDRSYELVSIRISFGDLVQPPFWDHFGLLHVSPFSGTQDGFQGHTILFRVWRYEWLRSHTACVRSKVNLEVLSGIRPIDNSKHFMLFPSLDANYSLLNTIVYKIGLVTNQQISDIVLIQVNTIEYARQKSVYDQSPNAKTFDIGSDGLCLWYKVIFEDVGLVLWSILGCFRSIANRSYVSLFFWKTGTHSFATQSSNFVRITIVVVKSIVTTFAIMIVSLSETWFQSHSATIDVVTACSPAAGFHLMCPWKAWFQGHKTTKPCFLDG